MNTPNKLSLSRILMIPLVIFFYLASFIPCGKLIAVGIFILASVTDFLDGYIARKYNMVTNLGKLLDPIADKLLVMSSLLLVVVDGTIPSPWGVIIAIIIIGRELLISAFRQIAATKNFVMAADIWGKIKTFVTDISLPLLFVQSYLIHVVNATGLFMDIFIIFNYVLIAVATLLTILSGANYLIKNREVLK